MTEWRYAERDPYDQLAHLHYFSMVKRQGDQEIEFVITVREFVSPKDPSMPFFAEADRQVNQATAPYTPIGWGMTLLDALSACMDAVRRFPYQPQQPDEKKASATR